MKTGRVSPDSEKVPPGPPRASSKLEASGPSGRCRVVVAGCVVAEDCVPDGSVEGVSEVSVDSVVGGWVSGAAVTGPPRSIVV